MSRHLCLATVLLLLAGCDLTGSDPGEFETTVTGDVSVALAGSAISDVLDDAAVVTLLPGGPYRGSQVQIAVRDGQLATTTYPLGSATADATLTFTFDSGPAATGGGGRLGFVATAGEVTLTRADGDAIEGRFTAQATSAESEVGLSGTFRAPRAFNP